MRKMTGSDDPAERAHVTLAEAAGLLTTLEGKRSSATVFEHGTLEVKLYAPRGADPQSTHARDELYVVARGEGWFVNGQHRHRFGRHDVIFAKAGVAHRFEGFSDDLLVWVFFYGPEGGEADALTATRGA
jgi:mannose-6-phosphate isomerase-like protein (cupin superfamily)